jgi:hypothetical protein
MHRNHTFFSRSSQIQSWFCLLLALKSALTSSSSSSFQHACPLSCVAAYATEILYLNYTLHSTRVKDDNIIVRGYEISSIRETTKLNFVIMSLISATKASLQFSRRIIVPPTPTPTSTSALLQFIIPNNIESKDGSIKSFSDGRCRCHHSYHHHRHQHQHQHQHSIEIESSSSILCRRHFSSTSTNNRNDDDDDDDSIKEQEQSPTLMERTEKNILQRMYDKFSMSEQTNRILMAESLLQAATSQANDP